MARDSIKIGYSHTLLYREQNLGQKLDGIGVHTKFLYQEIVKTYGKVYPYDFCRLKQVFNRGQLQPPTILSTIWPSFISLHKEIENKVDVFHATDYLIPRLKNTPVVATLHDAIMFKTPNMASKFRIVKNAILKRSAHWASNIITVSQTMVEDIVNYWDIKPEKISVVHNGLDPIWYHAFSENEKLKVLKKFNIQKPFILSVGTLQPRKNFLRLIKAFENLPDNLKNEFELIIVGREGWGCQDIIASLKKLEEKNQGRWLHYVEFEDLRALFQAATVFAFPSLAEGFGLPVVESFASSTPVLAANTTSIPEIAEDAALLVDPEDTEALSNGLQQLLENKDLRKEYIEKGQKRAANFSWQRCAQETYKVLESVC